MFEYPEGMPRIDETLALFREVPPRYVVDWSIYCESWIWATSQGDQETLGPEPCFSCDNLPVLVFNLVEYTEDGPITHTFSGITLF